jgi:tetratricopeptide (TPR) repeat protein
LIKRLLVLVVFCSAVFELRADTVLVLPFFNVSKSANLDWIGESISERIRESLASEGLLVLEREDRQEAFRRLSIRQYALLTHASVIKIGEALDATHVVYGEFEPKFSDPSDAASKASLRITARILNLKRIHQSQPLTELGALEDLASLETHLAWQSLKYLAPKTASTEEQFRKTWPPLRVDAIENYIRGLLATAPDQKHRFFTQAARLDARFSQPCFQLGRIYAERKDYRVAAGWLERVTQTDSHYLEAQFLLALCRYHTGDYTGAETAFQLVARSVPLNEVINDLGAAQSRLNKPEAIETLRKALDGDSADPDYHFNVGYALWKRQQYSDAADSFRAVLDRNPDDSEAVLMLGRCLKGSGPRLGDPKSDGLERLKTNYEETAYRQLKAELESKR